MSLTRVKRINNIQKKLLEWGRDHYDNFPWRASNNDFHGLIAEAMLQRTKAEQVIKVYNNFTSKFITIQDAYTSDSDKILQILAPLGLTWRNRKILELIKALNKIQTIPDSKDELIKLPGVGEYVCNAYLSFHKNVRATIIDRNAVRLWSRIYSLKTDGNTQKTKAFKKLVDEITPKYKYKKFNYAVIDHTRRICKLKPMCLSCSINSYCDYFANT